MNKKKITSDSSKIIPIVGIGASAGGLEALKLLLKELPKKTGLSLVIIQHLDPTHQSNLVEILERISLLPVSEIKNGTRPQPDQVYIIPPNHNLVLSKGAFKLSKRGSIQKYNLPIDIFLCSLAEEQKNAAIGVILSGTGSDGTQGLLAIKAAGGITFVQDPDSAKFDGMPKSAIKSEAADFILAPVAIAKELATVVQNPYLIHVAPEKKISLEDIGAKESVSDKSLRKIFSLLYKITQVDFFDYKRTTILRRLFRRLFILKINDFEVYANYLENHSEEIKLLFADILIHVTSFFRDPEIFESLKNKLLPRYFNGHNKLIQFRAWVPGCSTGEEAYSLAIILLEYMDEVGLQIPLQIFATDISEQALKKARAGVYEDIEQNVSKERLLKFFEKTSGGYKISKRLREICIFSKHDLNRDPPFAKIDLISCRNVLIYFEKKLQKKILPIFHYTLKPSGILFLGHSENIGDFTNLFSLENKTGKIYFKKNISTPIKVFPTLVLFPADKTESNKLSIGTLDSKHDVQKESDRIAVLEYAPPSVVINDSMEVLQIRGQIAPFFELAQGQAGLSLQKMVRPELMPVLRSLIQSARTKNIKVKKENMLLFNNKRSMSFNINVVPLSASMGSKEHNYVIFLKRQIKLV